MLSLFHSRGVLGLNARNLLYVDPYNPRAAKAFADDKMKTKAYLSARGIPTAKVYARISNRDELREFDFASLPDYCVLKPNYGYGGEGIMILKGRKNGESAGFYDYTGGKETLNAAAAAFGPPEKITLEPAAIAERLNGVMIDVTKRVLAEGVVKTADEADFALLLGAGFPAWRGGLMRYARSIGA